MLKYLVALFCLMTVPKVSQATDCHANAVVERVIVNGYQPVHYVVAAPQTAKLVERVVFSDYDYQPVAVEKIVVRERVRQPVQIVEKVRVERVRQRVQRVRVRQNVQKVRVEKVIVNDHHGY